MNNIFLESEATAQVTVKVVYGSQSVDRFLCLNKGMKVDHDFIDVFPFASGK